jgi:small-conductance mechanosensitive channel
MKIIRIIVSLQMFLLPVSITAGNIVETITEATKKLTSPTQELVIGVVAEKQKQRDELVLEKEESRKKAEEFDIKAQTILSEVKNLMEQAESEQKITPDNEYLKMRIVLLGETMQSIKDTTRAYSSFISLLDRFIKALNDYLLDSNFKEFRSHYAIYERSYHSFNDIIKLHDQIVDLKNRVNMLVDQERSATTELESRRQGALATAQSYKKKQADLVAAMREGQTEGPYADLSDEQLAELSRLEESLYAYQKILDEITIKKIERKVSLTAMELFVEKTRLATLREYFRKAKPGIRVSELDIAEEKEALATEKKQYYAQKEGYRHQIDEYSLRMAGVEKEVIALSEELNVPRGRDLNDWDRKLNQAAEAYLNFCRVAAANSVFVALDYRRELLQAQEALLDEKFELQDKKLQVKESYYKAVIHSGVPEEVVTRELKRYDAPRAKAKANVSRYEESARRSAESLGDSKRVLDRLSNFRKEIQDKKNTIFKTDPRAYSECLLLLNQAEARVRERIDILGRLTGAYSNITTQLNDILRLINFITDELSALIGVLSRSEYAVTWDGFKNIMSDIGTFCTDIRSYVMQFKISAFILTIQEVLWQPFALFLFILQLLVVLFMLFALRAGIRWMSPILQESANRSEGFARAIRLFLLMFMEFFQAHFVLILSWITIFAAIVAVRIPDPYLFIFFYLLSIPVLLYLSRRFILHFRAFNAEHEYVFIAHEFEWRFFNVVATLLYVTVIITLFREAFKLANYYKSELPTILLAVNFIVFQTALMLLLTKDLILNLIPTGNTPFWRDVCRVLCAYIDRYFLLIQIAAFAIIVMSNPYVGFGKLVLYVFRSFALTSLLIALFFWLYGQFKSGASRIFFTSSDEVVHERFTNAKTWFGVIIVGSFCMFATIAGFIIARIWGWMITSQDVVDLIQEPLMFKGTPDPITLFSIAKIALFIFGGIALSYVLNRFVLDRLFALFLVEAGVQHTVTSITRYLVVGIAILIGFTYVGLGQHIGVLLAALVFSIGWVLKDPISDFAAYFIILVQRPLKIGDYVELNSGKIAGVVRKITPRSIVLRRKNSTTLIIPNSYTMNQTIENWNYTRNFVAFNDISITVEYAADPEKVKGLLYQVVEEHQNVLRNPKPIVRLDDFGVYGYVFLVRGYISPVYVLEMWDIASDLRLAMVKRLRENGIFVAIPIRKVFSGKPGLEFGYDPEEKNQ